MKANNRNRGVSGTGQHTRRWIMGVVVAAAIAALVAVFLHSNGSRQAAGEPAIPPGTGLTSWIDNGQGGQYVLQILEGIAPASGIQVSGTVVSDTDCKPDAQDFNHCHNVIKLADGSRITVMNTHRMRIHRCLKPGEVVTLTRLNASWVVVSLPRVGASASL